MDSTKIEVDIAMNLIKEELMEEMSNIIASDTSNQSHLIENSNFVHLV